MMMMMMMMTFKDQEKPCSSLQGPQKPKNANVHWADKDTLCVCCSDGVVWQRVCTQERHVGIFRLQSLTERLQLLKVVASIHKLFVLKHKGTTKKTNYFTMQFTNRTKYKFQMQVSD